MKIVFFRLRKALVWARISANIGFRYVANQSHPLLEDEQLRIPTVGMPLGVFPHVLL